MKKLIVFAALIIGCVGTWQENAMRTIAVSATAIDAATSSGIAYFGAKCNDIASKCDRNEGISRTCKALIECQHERRELQNAMVVAQNSLLAALASLQASQQSDTDAKIKDLTTAIKNLISVVNSLSPGLIPSSIIPSSNFEA